MNQSDRNNISRMHLSESEANECGARDCYRGHRSNLSSAVLPTDITQSPV